MLQRIVRVSPSTATKTSVCDSVKEMAVSLMRQQAAGEAALSLLRAKAREARQICIKQEKVIQELREEKASIVMQLKMQQRDYERIKFDLTELSSACTLAKQSLQRCEQQLLDGRQDRLNFDENQRQLADAIGELEYRVASAVEQRDEAVEEARRLAQRFQSVESELATQLARFRNAVARGKRVVAEHADVLRGTLRPSLLSFSRRSMTSRRAARRHATRCKLASTRSRRSWSTRAPVPMTLRAHATSSTPTASSSATSASACASSAIRLSRASTCSASASSRSRASASNLPASARSLLAAIQQKKKIFCASKHVTK
jgi:hypothetical protein